MSGIKQVKFDRLKISAHPRIHVSLIGMNDNGYRINGGLGFSISSPTLNIVFEASDMFSITDYRSSGFTDAELHRLKDLIKRASVSKHFNVKYKAVIEDGPVCSHVGLGSNTIVYLACVEALYIINGADYSSEDIVNCSSRGGTSGVGINSYFNGGFVLDIGVPNKESCDFAPSSCYLHDHQLPLVLHQAKLPNWDLGICIPSIPHKTEVEEQAFFMEKCPIDRKSVEEILYESVYGVTASIMEHDFEVFCNSIDKLQTTRWKSLERNLYGTELKNIEERIRTSGAKCVGMSSLGPLLYFFGENIQDIIDRIISKDPNATCFASSFNNCGRMIEYD